ncbi:hypothetical protein GJ629_00865 [Halapricum sp. CBA1109]|uniref:DUF7344 domain-containing protein n=1 Tax=Halapricum sp. CBA1109 TaxID=2668068 RepID=UPI0012F87506|nr:hypothetical protein [Halapricum sp. CBA1109]MUV88619.1 hypothetical protein [Halapricum sp. CBA1109]
MINGRTSDAGSTVETGSTGSTGESATTDGSSDGHRGVDESAVGAHSISIDQIFEILKNQRRRSVLRYMQTAGEEVRLGELAEQIAAWECDKEVSEITSSERKRVYVGLYQCHLPKMDDVDAIAYNKPRGKIAPGDNSETFEHYLPDDDAESEARWSQYHTYISVLSVLAIGSLALLAAVGSTPPAVVGTAAVLGVLSGLPLLPVVESVRS